MEISKHYSLNHNNKPRSNKNITLIIIHYTGMQSERESIRRLASPRSKVSCHYLINRKGKIFNMVRDHNIAWHAGKSRWKEYKNLNKNSIGIELVNKGHKYGYQSFTKKQISMLVKLCKKLKRKYRIKNKSILGHSDVAPLRKIDPGEKFPWSYLSSKGMGIYPKKNLIISRFEKSRENKKFIKNLYKIGYRYLNGRSKRKIIKNFQRRYRQNRVSGVLDQETFKISEFLAKKLNIS
tara:strand:- start:156 stop:866 length:711 start_codon:yes stop_codon:yes gene_type:complete